MGCGWGGKVFVGGGCGCLVLFGFGVVVDVFFVLLLYCMLWIVMGIVKKNENCCRLRNIKWFYFLKKEGVIL